VPQAAIMLSVGAVGRSSRCLYVRHNQANGRSLPLRCSAVSHSALQSVTLPSPRSCLSSWSGPHKFVRQMRLIVTIAAVARNWTTQSTVFHFLCASTRQREGLGDRSL